MTTPLVSILLITYNQEDFVRKSILSAVEQDYDNLEVVVTDDASTDGTSQIIADIEKEYPGRVIPVLGRTNLGITGNCNRGLKHCRGRYVALLAGDDLYLPGKITQQVAWLEEDEDRVLCGHDSLMIDEKGEGLGYFSDNTPLSAGTGPVKIIREAALYSATSVMVRRSAIPSYGFDETLKYASDWKLQVDCLVGNGAYGYVEGVYSKYRVHAGGVTSVRKVECYEDAIRGLRAVRCQYPDFKHATYLKESEHQFVLSYLALRSGQILRTMSHALGGVLASRLIHLPISIRNVIRLKTR